MQNDSNECILCKTCSKSVSDNITKCNDNCFEKCQLWLQEKCNINSDDDSLSNSVVETIDTSDNLSLCTTNTTTSEENENNVLIEKTENSHGDVNVLNSKHVVIGNITYVNGPVHLEKSTTNILQKIVINQSGNENSSGANTNTLTLIQRRNWLAQPALLKTPLSKPIRYVIIAHTATEEGFNRAENTLLVRLVQTFHIESRKFNDISYNFLIGSDGIVYEGRGWDFEGEHTHGYDNESIAISFIGCFMQHLPPACALNAAKLLIQHGIELKVIPEDYILVGHCQCLPIESPGRRLFEEIKTWPRWKEIIPETEHT